MCFGNYMLAKDCKSILNKDDMKLVQETPTNLVLKQQNYLGIIVGITFLLVGGIGFFVSLGKGMEPLIITGILFLVGICIILVTKFITITIDKTQQNIIFTFRSLLGTKRQNYAISQIKEVSIEEYVTTTRDSHNNTTQQLNYNLVFYLQDGQGIPIPIGSKTGFSPLSIMSMFSQRNQQMELGKKIADFIGVPFVDRRPPTFTQAVSAVMTAVSQEKQMTQPQLPPTPPITPANLK